MSRPLLTTKPARARLRELERQVANRTKELATLKAIAAVTSHSLRLQEILTGALEKTLEVTELEAGGIYLLQKDNQLLTIGAYKGLSAQFIAEIDNLKVGEGFSGRVAQTGEALIVPDVSADPRLTRLIVQEGGFHALAVIPLLARGKVLGSMFLMTRRYRDFSTQEMELLKSIGHQIGVAIENARLFDAEQRRAEQFRVINEVGRHLTSILDVDQLLEEIAQALQKAFGYGVIGIALVEGDTLVMKAAVPHNWRELGIPALRLQVGGQGVIGWVAGAGQPLLVPDVSQDPRYLPWPANIQTRSEMAVPLKTKSGTIGVLNVESDRLNAFDESDLAVVQALANQAAIAVENARHFHTEQRRAEQFRVISEVGRHITSILDVEQLLQEIVRLIKETFGYYLVTIGLIEGEQLVFKAGVKTRWPESQFIPGPVKVGGHGITAWVAATGEPLLAADVSQEPRYLFWPDTAETRSELAVALKTKAGIIGVLNVESDQLNAFDESDVTVLQSLAHQAAIALENARLYNQAQQAAVLEERQRLARDLHDSVSQALYGMTLYSQAAASQLSAGCTERAADYLRELQDTAQEALAEMRLLIFELRPPILEEEGLVAALQSRLQAVEGRAGLRTEFQAEVGERLPPRIEEGLYRIAQEVLNNAVKHARARNIAVHLRRQERTVTLAISDDGVGFDPATARRQGGLGLSAVEERATELGGRLTLQSQPGEGTRVLVEVGL
jgi:GAF domain-containing protein